MKIFIYSIPRKSAFGIHDWTSEASGKKLLKTKIWKCTDKIQAFYNPKFGGFANGLSYKPWIENGEQVKDKDGKPLMLQHKMEQKWGLPENFLTNKLNHRDDPKNKVPLSYYTTKVWKLNDGCTVLDLDNFDDEMFYYVCLESKLVANSEKEWKQHLWPKAQYYIALENEAEELKYNKNQIKSKAFALLHNDNMTPSNKEKIASVLELTNSFAALTIEQIDNLLFEYIDKSTFAPGSNIDKFTDIANQLNTPTGRENLEAKYLLKKGLDSRIVYEKQGAYNWTKPTGQITLGENYLEAVEFILNPKKSALVEELEQEIKIRTIR